jgi:UDP-glucose 4-epimerase
MKILITGGMGYIGSHTVVELIKAGVEVVILDNLSNSSIQVIERIKNIVDPDGLSNINIPFIKADLRDIDKIKDAFTYYKFDGVIHFAGLKSVGESVTEPLSYYGNNVLSTINLLNIMNDFGVKNIVFSSSATVYSQENESPLNEDMALSTINPYGESKLMVERMLDDLSVSDDEWNIVKLRYFNPIGAHESGAIGESPNGIPNNLLPYVTQVANGNLDTLSIFGNDYETIDGTGVRDYIHVVDLAKGHLCAINKIKEFNGSHAINLGTGNGYSVLDIVKQFKEETGIEIAYQFTERRPGDLASVFSNPSKANNLLNWHAEKTLANMLFDAWNWQHKNPNGYISKGILN